MNPVSGPLCDHSSSPAAASSRAALPPTVVRLERIALIGLLLGGLATWPLWTGGQAFPQIPWFGWVTGVPRIVDPVLLGLCGCAVLVQLIAPRQIRACARIVVSVAAVGLVLLDQHRLQVWVLHLLCVLWLLWLSPNARGVTLVRAFVISIYVHSAVSRFDRASLEQQWTLIAPLLERSGVATRFVSESQRLSAGAVFAAWELGVAVLLAFPLTRQTGLWGSIAMHAGLIAILGPLGQDHHPGVLIWNAVWIAQNFVLFGREAASVAGHDASWRKKIATTLAAVVVLAPFTEPHGWWDHWPSWRVYSARPETVTLYVDGNRVDELPERVRQYAGPFAPLSDWRPVNFDAWSFDELRCPVYPQARFRLAVVRSIVREHGLGDRVRVVVGSPPDRWTGRRTMSELHGERAIEEACGRFVMNTAARDLR